MNHYYNKKESLLAYENLKLISAGKPDLSELNRLLLADFEDPLQKLPFLAMKDTLYGKMESYHAIADSWLRYDGSVDGWVLLALIDTIEQMSSAVYEYYRALVDRFRLLLRRYLLLEHKQDYLAGLAISKACRLHVILPDRYEKTANTLIAKTAPDIRLDKAAQKQWGIPS